MYAMMGTRPDIAFAVSVLSRHYHKPTKDHWTAVQGVFRYLKGTLEVTLIFRLPLNATSPRIFRYSDVLYLDNYSTLKLTYGYIFTIGSGAIS